MNKPPRPCRKCGQRATRNSLCQFHFDQHEARRGGNSNSRGYGAEHEKAFRQYVLGRDPICQMCGNEPSRHADHYPQTRRTLERLGLNPNDPQYGRGLCASCHTAHTNKTR